MHPLSGAYAFSLGKPYAAVRVMHEGKKLIIQPGDVFLVKPDVQFAELPPDFKVVSQEGEAVNASGKILISIETMDPFHIVVDYQE